MSYYSHTRSSLLKYIKFIPNTVLEVGCGEGNFGKVLKGKFSCFVWGIEPVNEAAKVAYKQLDKVSNDFFQKELDLPQNHFDLITFNDVLEHMASPWDALEYSKKLLTTNGRIMASIPNFFYFYDFVSLLKTKDWKYQPSGLFDKTHLRFFTKKSMIRMFEECGYEIESVQGIGKVKSKKLWLLNLLTLGYCTEMYFMQHLLIAKVK